MTPETMIPVNSSLITAVGYDVLTNTLYVQFKRGGGAIWQYDDVPREVYEGFISSDSIGRFFLAKIKHVYTGKKISDNNP